MNINKGAYALTGSACPRKVEIEFLEAMQHIHGLLDVSPVADGAIHRFHVPGDKRGTRHGAYALFPEGIPAGWFGTWKDGGHWHNWRSREPANPLEAVVMRQRNEQAKQQRDAEQLQRQQFAAQHANCLWRKARRADPDHPYLIAKGCQPHHLRQLGGKLLVPLYHDRELVNLQLIAPNGNKRFLPDGRVKGCYSPLGTIKPGQPLYECEGWATGATIHEKTGCPVACAMTSSNLLEVGRHLRCRYAEVVLIIAGDDDRQTKGNPGRTVATMTASALGCKVAFPKWPTDAPLHLSDFNDLRQWRDGGNHD